MGNEAQHGRLRLTLILICAGMACAATACSKEPVGEIEHLGSGEYRLTYSFKAEDDAIRKAGEFCHAKGQKLSVEYTGHDVEIRFRCVPSD